MLAKVQETNEQEVRDSGGLLCAFLSGFFSSPATGGQFAETGHRPLGLTLRDDVEQVVVGIDVQDCAVLNQRVHSGQALATKLRSGEKEIVPANSEVANSPLNAAVVNLEPPVFKATSKEGALRKCVRRRTVQNAFGQQLPMVLKFPFQ